VASYFKLNSPLKATLSSIAQSMKYFMAQASAKKITNTSRIILSYWQQRGYERIKQNVNNK